MSAVANLPLHRSARLVVAMLLSIALATAACGSDDPESSDTVEDSEAATVPSAESATPSDPLEDVHSAVVRIETTSNVVEPDSSLLEPVESISWGGGSGFIIDPSGLAVTNQHVVGGAATIAAHVEGHDEPTPARLVGSSQCADLAVIELEGDGYPTLDWYEGEVAPGLDIFVAGFPLGDPEYTLLDGIVSKARTDGETSWASVDWVIEHTAPTQPGNSGGPVVTPGGEVVAVNYAYGQPGTGTSQHFAIAREVAVPLIEELQGGERGLGITGQAVVDDEVGVSGVWVSAVDTGSPADVAGIEPGDIIERLEGLPVGSDGTLEAYCNVLESHSPDDAMTVQVLRFAEEVRLRGSFNGTPLAPVESLGEAVSDVVEVEETPSYEDYVLITDDTAVLEVAVPASWTDIDGYFPFISDDGSESGVGLRAAPDLEAFTEKWAVPGMTFSALPGGDNITVDDLLTGNVEAFTYLEACTPHAPDDYDDGLYVGTSQLFTECAETSTGNLLIAAEDESNNVVVFLSIQIVSDADLEALDRIIETFRVVGDLAPESEPESELAPEAYSDYQEVIDDSGLLGVEVPVEWTDIRSGPGFHSPEDPDDESLFHGVGLNVSTDVDAWRESWGVPGVRMATTGRWSGAIADWFYGDYTNVVTGGWFYRGECVEAGVSDYEDPLYSGVIGTYTDCGGGDTGLTVIVASPPDDEYVLLVAVTTVTDADGEALDRILRTFQVLGEVPI